MKLPILFCLLLLSIIACKDPNHETISVNDEHGKLLEKYSRNKKNAAKDGPYQRFYPNGTIKEEAFYQNDTMTGVHKFYYANGAVEIEENYQNGNLHGPYKKFFPNGTISVEQNYQNGVLAGLSKGFYENGTIKEEVIMQENEENGPFTEYYENGNLKAKGRYLNGPNEQDSLYLYDTNGQLEKVMFCESGICHTIRSTKPQ